MRWGHETRIAVAVLASLGLLGCQDQGPMEEFGEKIDEKVEAAHDAVTGDKGPFETAGEKIDEAASKAQDKINEATSD